MITRITAFLEAIKFSHSVFALPFALVAMLVAAQGFPGWWITSMIIVACVAARTAAMCFNRIADRTYDARNPRTATRALVTGELSLRFMWTALVGSSLVFFLAALLINTTCFILSPPTLGILLLYSYTKRFTSYAHVFLGIALGLAPLGAWIAVLESISMAPVLLSLAVLAWVAGFDILYSCQDVENDRREAELHSIPKRLGVARAMRFARNLHALAAGLFLAFWWFAELGLVSLIGVALIAVLLERQHRLVSPRDLSRINAAFFTMNGYIALGFLGFVWVDVVLMR